MFDPKLSGIAGGLGFVLSFLVGLISGVGFPWILLRALLFGAAFFALAGGAYWLVTRFLPELLEQGEEEAGLDADSPGSRVDISVTGEGAAGEPSPGMDASTGLTDLVGGASPSDENAGPLYGNGLDQKAEDGYTRKGTVDEGPVSGAPPSPQGAAVPAQEEGSSDTVDELPDLELMSDVFITPPLDGGGGEFIETGSGGSAGGKKPKNLGGDFNVKEMASAIQTILKREDKG
ncbi:MAG: hypothetical protein LBP93_02085 [Treponema sp.]|jgi:hypothetical protein|nr:hypothetical protein [Treponema sp.]